VNRISEAFSGKKALITFVTGGDPDTETTEKLIYAMEEGGADIIEIGIPFSDPIAEGTVIQRADERALAGGCTVDELFDMVARARKRTKIPLLFMTYVNPIFKYGKERFMIRCRDSGIDGVIVPDLPYEENGELKDVCMRYGIALISMIAPTSGDRAERIAKGAEGFLYCVSSLGVTGVRSTIDGNIADLIRNVRTVSSIPCAVGFGISTSDQVHQISKISDGVIVGSAIVKIVAEHGTESPGPVKQFIKELKAGMLR
jgi:tryptophan synthase alpha chain